MARNRLSFTANLQRHSHNVTAGYTASIAPGMIVPQYFDILQPNDKIFFKTHMFVRAQDITTAFLGEVDLYIDYWFVPLQMLYTLFGQSFANTNDVISSFYDYSAMSNIGFPYGSLNDYFDISSNYTGLSNTTTFNGVSECELKGVYRLLDALNFNPNVVFRSQPASTSSYTRYAPNGTYFSLLAYQAIYQKGYRNEENETFDVGAYNIDVNYSQKKYSNIQLTKFLKLRYHQRPNDYFTEVRFSPIATSVNALFDGSSAGALDSSGGDSSKFATLIYRINKFVFPSTVSLNQQEIGSALGESSPTMDNANGAVVEYNKNVDTNSYLNAMSIRGIFAVDKYMRIYGRAGKSYDDQILAHFGIKVPHDVKHDLTKIKSYHMVLQSDPVLTTADTEFGFTGSVGGQLSAQLDSNEASFTAPVHGVFMAVAYVFTHPRYYGTTSRLNAITDPSHLPMPEFEKLGAQPVYNYESGDDVNVVPTNRSYWTDRYAEWKRKYNRCSMVYAHDYGASGENFFSPWVISRSPYVRPYYSGSTLYYLHTAPFFESAYALDNVMAVHFNGNWSLEFVNNPHLVMQTDPLLTEFCCFAKKVSWMSPSGEPDL